IFPKAGEGLSKTRLSLRNFRGHLVQNLGQGHCPGSCGDVKTPESRRCRAGHPGRVSSAAAETAARRPWNLPGLTDEVEQRVLGGEEREDKGSRYKSTRREKSEKDNREKWLVLR
ncbi:mCG141043, partial [Mus musculus]